MCINIHILAEFQQTHWICPDVCRFVLTGPVRALQVQNAVSCSCLAPTPVTRLALCSSLLHGSDNWGTVGDTSVDQSRRWRDPVPCRRKGLSIRRLGPTLVG